MQSDDGPLVLLLCLPFGVDDLSMAYYGDGPPQYSAYPPQGYQNRPPPDGPPPPGGPRPGQDDRGLTGTLVGLGAAAVAGQAVQQHMNNPQQPGVGGGGALGPGAGAEDPLAVLRRFDTVILVDDSASMQEENRWSQAEQSLRGVADTVVRYDSVRPSPSLPFWAGTDEHRSQDGVDVYFLNASEYVRNARSAQQISQAFSRVRPVGASTPTEVRVEELLGM